MHTGQVIRPSHTCMILDRRRIVEHLVGTGRTCSSCPKIPDLELNPRPLCDDCGHDCTSAHLQERNKSVLLLNSLPQIGL